MASKGQKLSFRAPQFCLIIILQVMNHVMCDYTLDDTAGLGRRFDGIGAISGGGVSIKVHSVLDLICNICEAMSPWDDTIPWYYRKSMCHMTFFIEMMLKFGRVNLCCKSKESFYNSFPVSIICACYCTWAIILFLFS